MELGLFRDLKERDFRREGLFVAEGRWLVERLLVSGWEVLAVLCAPRFAEHFGRLAGGRMPVLCAPEQEIARVAGFPFHRGVLAAGRRPVFPSLAAWLDGAPKAGRATLVVCPQLTGEYNLGSILRSACALGAQAAVLGPRCCDPLSRRALKVSMGAAFRLPLLAMEQEEAALRLLGDSGYQVLGASPAPEAVPLSEYMRAARVALVLGEEAEGLPEPWRSGCDVRLRIPMAGGSDSLNVAVAAGILLHALG